MADIYNGYQFITPVVGESNYFDTIGLKTINRSTINKAPNKRKKQKQQRYLKIPIKKDFWHACLVYKLGKPVFPSSKRCSNCGYTLPFFNP